MRVWLQMPGNHLWKAMASRRRKKRRKKGSFSSLLLILGVLSLTGIQAAYHEHVIQFTTVGTGSYLLDHFMVDFLDDVQVFSYDKHNQQLMAKEAWISQALGAKFITKIRQKLVDHEKSFLWFLKKLTQNETKYDVNCMVQVFVSCEIEENSPIGNEIRVAVDGQDFFFLDEEMGNWTALMPEAQPFKPILTSPLWTTQKEHYMQEYCIDTMKKILQYSSIKKNVPPEVTVSHHEAMDGITTLACSATGFYPSSILLHWQKGKEIIVAGKESSSGTLPNADSTFYQRITIELPPDDPGTNYDCVVDHIELGTPKAYPVHVKYPKKRSWTATFTILGVVILVLSCAASFIMWKKMKTGYRILECVTLEGIIYTT
ncbi:major histocompatibility complex class I-related protein 1-like isoform X2 [Phascolarctos cinereus]|uniref:Major histocompatibility complex class I-related gene protein-like isoform X2 n=1 Tax=Phascolarctos cinereus TaxID=38626 RepID=A0A6P5LK02_PHACI|nr:major histocompatibility complex class I-related gene protein-like isoform X2 [Phascolarctos cinereus]